MTDTSETGTQVRPASEGDVDALSALRLDALRTEPAAFSNDYDVARQQTRGEWADWLRTRSNGTSCILYVADAGETLTGMAGIARGDRAKTSHSAFIWGVFVQPDRRRQATGRRLIEACLAWADGSGVEVVRLGVNSANPAAIGLYEACGFRQCGVFPRALRVDGVYYDELMMVRTLPRV